MIAFTAPLPPSELRPNRRAAHWKVRSTAGDTYSRAVWAEFIERDSGLFYQNGGVSMLDGTPHPSARVTYTWRYSGVAPDIDNIAGALKVLQDTLCRAPANGKPNRDRYFLGIIENDAGIEATFKREKVAHRSDEGVLVEVIPL